MTDSRRSRRPLVTLALLALALLLAWRAGMLPDLRRTSRVLEPPTREEMDRAAARDSARQARVSANTFTPVDPPVTIRQMLLWFALPVAGTALLIFVTARRGR